MCSWCKTVSENVNVSKSKKKKKQLLLCRLKCSDPELPSSTGVTSFILRLSFPSCSTAAGSSPSLLSSTEISLAAIVVSLVTSASDGSENEVISANHQKGKWFTTTMIGRLRGRGVQFHLSILIFKHKYVMQRKERDTHQ